MHHIQSITTLLCSSLLDESSEAELSHITLNLPQQSVSACYRAGFDLTTSTLSFTITPEHCLGSLLQDKDSEYWEIPQLVIWRSISEYQQQLQVASLPSPLPWCHLLRSFNSVELIRHDPETDTLCVDIYNGHQIARAGCWNELLTDLP